MTFLKKMSRILLKTLDFGAKYGIIVLLGIILGRAAIFQDNYTNQYADTYSAMEREVSAAQLASYLESERIRADHTLHQMTVRQEHDRQVIAARMIQSQEDWVIQCKHMREAYLEEKARRMQAKRDFYRTAQELYHLIRTLEYQYPDVYDEAVPDVLKKLPRELQDALLTPVPPEPNEAA